MQLWTFNTEHIQEGETNSRIDIIWSDRIVIIIVIIMIFHVFIESAQDYTMISICYGRESLIDILAGALYTGSLIPMTSLLA